MAMCEAMTRPPRRPLNSPVAGEPNADFCAVSFRPIEDHLQYVSTVPADPIEAFFELSR
jgi:hypothetical protein